MTKEKWLFGKDEMLIELVKNKPGLYDLQSPFYSDNHYKKTVWAEIEQELDIHGAKIRWEQLRAQYRKSLNKQKTKSGQAAAKISKWRFSDQMMFLNAYILNDRSRISSVTINESDVEKSDCVEVNTENQTNENNDNIEIELVNEPVKVFRSTPTLPKKKKKTNETVPPENASSTLMKYLLQKKEDERPAAQPMDTFFSLMAATVKNFSPNDQHYVKTQVFNLINQVEAKYLTPPPTPFLPSVQPIHRSLIRTDPNSKPASSSNSFFENFSSRASKTSFNSSAPIPQYTYSGNYSNTLQKVNSFIAQSSFSPQTQTLLASATAALRENTKPLDAKSYSTHNQEEDEEEICLLDV